MIDETKLIQVTDLVGLRLTGYYKGRPYYGQAFTKTTLNMLDTMKLPVN